MEADRRQDDVTRDRITQLTVATEKLLVVSEIQSKILDDHTTKISDHDHTLHQLDVEVRESKMMVVNWSNQIIEVKDQIKQLVASITLINQTGLKVRGGWITLVVMSSIVMGLVSLAKSFGMI